MPPETSVPLEIIHDSCDATTQHCIVVGRVERVLLEELLAACSSGVLWLVDAEYSRGIHYNGLLTIPIDTVSLEDFLSVLMRFVFRVGGILPGVKVSHSIEFLHSDRYAFFGKQMKGFLLSAAAFMPTQRARKIPASLHRQDRVIHNLEKLPRTLLPQSARNLFSEMPAVILGAGPSLDSVLPTLSKWQDHCLVFATDSTLSACKHHSIQPDFVINIDPDKSAQDAWPKTFNIGWALLSLQSTEDWFERSDDCAWILPMGSLTEHWVEQQGFSLGPRIAASNAGFTAVAMASFFGCKPIVLLGMDMASDPNQLKSTHSQYVSHTSHADDVQRVRETANIRYIPGNYEDTVPTIFYPFYQEMNAWLEGEGRSSQVVNITDRGAAFTNTTLVHPKDADAWFNANCPRPLENGHAKRACGLQTSQMSHPSIKPCLDKVRSAAGEALAKLKAYQDAPRDDAWRSSVVGVLRLVLQEKDVQGVLGTFFMDQLARLAAHQLPGEQEVEQLFEYTIQLLEIASAL